MDKWEYKVVSTGAGTGLEKLLNDLGEQGWELVGFVLPIEMGCKPVFKRKKGNEDIELTEEEAQEARERQIEIAARKTLERQR